MSQSQSFEVVDVSVDDAFRFLNDHPDAQLVDVRSRAEWTFVGAPSLPFRDAAPIFVEWQVWPDMQIDPAFPERLRAELARRGVGVEAPLLFLCRSGQRSRSAAQAMRAVGHARCMNVADGFEGPLDGQGHRGALKGWRAAGLPWRQS